MALISKIKRTYSRFKQISLESNKSILKIILDFYKCHRLYEISFFEYHNYEFEKKDLKYRESFLSFKKRRRLLLDNINPHNYAFIARNKFFSHLLLEELNIPKAELICYYEPNSNIKHNRIGFDYSSVFNILKSSMYGSLIIKPTESAHGEGVILAQDIEFIDGNCYMTISNKRVDLRSILNNNPLLFEEVIVQTKQFNNFNNSSINTIRIMSVLHKNGIADLIPGFFRIGRKGSIADNAGDGGNVCADVDINTILRGVLKIKCLYIN